MTDPVSQNIPSKDPSEQASLEGVLRSIMRKQLQGVDGMLPATVVSYDAANNVATVRPLISLLTTTGQVIPRGIVAEVPVLKLAAGGFFVHFPIAQGDLGWIEASDRDISKFIEQLSDAPPPTMRTHSFMDGRFVPDAFRNYPIQSADSGRMVIGTQSGAVRLSIGTSDIQVYGPTTYHDRVTFSQGFDSVQGSSAISSVDKLKIAGIEMGTHVHDDPQGGTVGGPHN